MMLDEKCSSGAMDSAQDFYDILSIAKFDGILRFWVSVD